MAEATPAARQYDPAIGRETARGVEFAYLVDFTQRYCAPIVFNQKMHDGNSQVRGGTCTLVQIGQRRLLVTNDHVIRAYEELRDRGDAGSFQVGATVVDPDALLIARDRDKDLATLDVQDVNLDDRLAGDPVPPLAFYRIESWRPEALKPGETLACAGFTGLLRSVEGDTLFHRALLLAGVPITRIDGSYIVANVQDPRAQWRVHSDDGLTPFSPQLQNFRGMSGGPVFVDRLGDVRLDLVAIVSEHLESVNQLRLTRLDAIAPDGSIARGTPA